MRAPAFAALARQVRDVARAVAQHRQRLLGQRRDHELARLALGRRLSAVGIDYLEQEVVLPAVQARLGLFALGGDPGPEDFGQAVDVDRLQAETGLDFLAHRLAPRLRTEDADLQARFA